MAYNENDVRAAFQNELGRDPTAQELQDFLRYTGTGQVDLGPLDIQSQVRSLPQAQEAQLGRYGQAYGAALAGSDAALLQRAQDQLQGEFARQGRTFVGSPYTAAFANAARDLAIGRQNLLGQFYGQGYQGILANTQRGAEQARAFGNQQLMAARQREFDVQDYYRQQNDFNAYTNAQNRTNLRNALIQGGIGILGAGLGGYASGLGYAKGLGGFAGAGKSAAGSLAGTTNALANGTYGGFGGAFEIPRGPYSGLDYMNNYRGPYRY